jgi:hypothetical protein
MRILGPREGNKKIHVPTKRLKMVSAIIMHETDVTMAK